MALIGRGYGSEWHLLRYLGYHRNLFEKALHQRVGKGRIEWKDFPFSSKNEALKRDKEYKSLNFLDDQNAKEEWRSYWPTTGNQQNWDAIAKLKKNGSEEWLLFEAKAHLDELQSSCGAKADKSVKLIDTALKNTLDEIGNNAKLKDWKSPYYQYSNRLTVLHFLNQICDIPSRLVFVYFTGDQFKDKDTPTDIKTWEKKIHAIHKHLELQKNHPLLKKFHEIYLHTNPNVQ